MHVCSAVLTMSLLLFLGSDCNRTHTLAHHVLLCASSECLLRVPRQRADMWNRSRPKVGPWVQNTVSETRVGCSGLSVLCRSRDRLSARDSRRTFLIHRILFSTPKKDPLILRLHGLMSPGYSTFCLAVRSRIRRQRGGTAGAVGSGETIGHE